jgi:hypothetical protein
MELITGIIHPYTLIVVEKDEPVYGVMVYEFDQDTILEGQIQAMKAINTFVECRATGEWPAYPTGIHPLGLPGWVKRQNYIIE